MLQGVTANLMFTDLILNVFNGGICIMSGAFQPAVMARIFPRYIFGFLCTHCTHRHTHCTHRHTQHTQPGQESGQIFIWDENGGENNQRAYVRPHSKVAKKQKPCIFFQLDFTSKGDALGQFSWFWLQCYLQFFKTKKTILPTHLGHLPDLQLHLEHIICDVFILWYS